MSDPDILRCLDSHDVFSIVINIGENHNCLDSGVAFYFRPHEHLMLLQKFFRKVIIFAIITLAFHEPNHSDMTRIKVLQCDSMA